MCLPKTEILKKIKTPVLGQTLSVLLKGRHATPLARRWFTMSATDLRECFGISSSKLVGLPIVGWKTNPARLFESHSVQKNILLGRFYSRVKASDGKFINLLLVLSQLFNSSICCQVHDLSIRPQKLLMS